MFLQLQVEGNEREIILILAKESDIKCMTVEWKAGM